uniref:Tudor domain-containing protein n=1 Tax=Glossina austeni TaxID=7395 RepID=A0A1A9UNP6_GLOAU
MHKVGEHYLGQTVATIFKHDNKWYRAEVVGILPNQYNREELVLDLYFVEINDRKIVKSNQINNVAQSISMSFEHCYQMNALQIAFQHGNLPIMITNEGVLT